VVGQIFSFEIKPNFMGTIFLTTSIKKIQNYIPGSPWAEKENKTKNKSCLVGLKRQHW